MTVEERVEWCLDQKGGRPLFGDEARAIIRQALRDQIEDCAKTIEDQFMKQKALGFAYPRLIDVIELGTIIRALAGQTEQTEGKEGGR
jgi:hypothetical protein